MASATSHEWKFDKRSTALQVVAGESLEGKYAIVTGANTGIGFETARALVSVRCHVVLACRDTKKAKDAVDKIKSEYPNGKAEAMRLDLGSLSEVKKFADAYIQKGYALHYLILNAGVATDDHQTSVDGFELTYQTNHVAQMYLTQLVESQLVASAPSRVVVVSSQVATFLPQNLLTTETLNEAFFVGSDDSYDGLNTYALSKCLNVLYARELSYRLSNRGVTTFIVHPGVIVTNILLSNRGGQVLLNSFSAEFKAENVKTTEQGAATSVFCTVEKGLEPFSGRFFTDCQVADLPAWLTDDALAKHLWLLSETLIAKMDKKSN